MDVQPQTRRQWRRLAEFISEIEIAMLVTAEPDGPLRSRPLRTLQMDADGALWFMTTISSAKIGEMDAHRRVSLSYMRPASERYVWASGITQILRDDDKAGELWRPGLRPWLPHGRDDPEAVLLKVSIEEAEYWDPGGGRMIPLITAAREPHSVRIKSSGAPRQSR
ncbi:MAG TPA: pyridoxamine 5'-phosphate oxidase family protein [Steroidobacteraceae bacterium]|nr:pyridoxamine 5'-phosphate oxidase family protein [Steroidobacteraceae bacterium]